jgi:hypothetical protein
MDGLGLGRPRPPVLAARHRHLLLLPPSLPFPVLQQSSTSRAATALSIEEWFRLWGATRGGGKNRTRGPHHGYARRRRGGWSRDELGRQPGVVGSGLVFSCLRFFFRTMKVGDGDAGDLFPEGG